MNVFEISCPKCNSNDFNVDDIYDIDGSIYRETISERWYCGCTKCGNCFVAEVTAETKIVQVDYLDND